MKRSKNKIKHKAKELRYEELGASVGKLVSIKQEA